MATIKYSHDDDDKAKSYEFQKPVLFSRDADGRRQVDFQAPVTKTHKDKEVTIQSPFSKERNEDGDREIKVQSPVKKEETENKTRVLFRG